jgi:hypothetical protein
MTSALHWKEQPPEEVPANNDIELSKDQQDALDEAAFWKAWDEDEASDA